MHEKHEMYMANVNQTLTYPMRPIFHIYKRVGLIGTRVELISTRVGLIGTCVGYARLFRYQHAGIGNAKTSLLGSKPMPGNANGFALQWNIGFMVQNICLISNGL